MYCPVNAIHFLYGNLCPYNMTAEATS